MDHKSRNDSKIYPLFRMANVVYKHAFWLYYPLFVLYKNISDRKEMTLLQHLVKPGDRIIDIGANIGVYTRRLAKLTGPDGEVNAFEPHPNNFALLARFTRCMPAIKTFHAAVGDRDETIDLYVSDNFNVDHRTYKTAEKRGRQKVPCCSIDSFLNGKTVDFIKMDIQGAEYRALMGMQKTLNISPQLTMLTELWPYGLTEAGSSCEEVIGLLQKNGFYLYLVINGTVIEYSEKVIGYSKTDYYSLLATKQPYQEH
ncbi:MAG: FkbM family methyltransferase [Vulcanimicrobiota bacterium]